MGWFGIPRLKRAASQNDLRTAPLLSFPMADEQLGGRANIVVEKEHPFSRGDAPAVLARGRCTQRPLMAHDPGSLRGGPF